MRFMVVIESPEKLWTDYSVVDLLRCASVAKCSSERYAEEIAAALNKCVPQDEPAGLLEAKYGCEKGKE